MKKPNVPNAFCELNLSVAIEKQQGHTKRGLLSQIDLHGKHSEGSNNCTPSLMLAKVSLAIIWTDLLYQMRLLNRNN